MAKVILGILPTGNSKAGKRVEKRAKKQLPAGSVRNAPAPRRQVSHRVGARGGLPGPKPANQRSIDRRQARKFAHNFLNDVGKKPRRPEPRLTLMPGPTKGFTRDQRIHILKTQPPHLGFKPNEVGTPAFREALDDAKKSNHPRTRRTARQIDQALKEFIKYDAPKQASARQPVVQARSPKGKGLLDKIGDVAGDAWEIVEDVSEGAWETFRDVSDVPAKGKQKGKARRRTKGASIPGLTATGLAPRILPRTARGAAEITRTYAEHPAETLNSDLKFVGKVIAGAVTAPYMLAKGALKPDDLWEGVKKDFSDRYGPAYQEHADWKKFRRVVRENGGLSYLLDFSAGPGTVGGKAAGAVGKVAGLKVVTKARPGLRIAPGVVRRQVDETTKMAPNLFRAAGQKAIDRRRGRRYARMQRDFDEGRRDTLPFVRPGPNEVVPGRRGLRWQQTRFATNAAARRALQLRSTQGDRLKPLHKAVKTLNAREREAVKYFVQQTVRSESLKGDLDNLLTFKSQGRAEHGLPEPTRTEFDERRVLAAMVKNPDAFFTPRARAVADEFIRFERGQAKRDPALDNPVQVELRRRLPQFQTLGIQRREGETNRDYLIRGVQETKAAGFGERPGYFPSERFDEPYFAEYAPGGTRTTHAPRRYTGKLFATGREQTEPQLFVDAMARSIKREVQWPSITQTLERVADTSLTGPRGLPVFRLREIMQREGIDPSEVAILLPGRVQMSLKASEGRLLPDADSDLDEFVDPKLRMALEEGIVDPAKLRDLETDPRFRGAKAYLIPKRIFEETSPTALNLKSLEGFFRVAGISRSKISRAMFFLNLPWVIANRVTNEMFAAIGGVTPAQRVAAQMWWRQLSPEAKREIAPFVQVHQRTFDLMQPQLGSMTPARMREAFDWYKHTWLGRRRPLKSSVDHWLDFEQKVTTHSLMKATLFREMVKDKRFVDLDGSMSRANSRLDSLADVVKLPANQQAKALRDNLPHLEEYARDLHKTLGNWTAFSRTERTILGNGLMFYPWLRFSLRWLFWTMPKDHPALLATMAVLTRMHEDELQEVFGEDVPVDMLSKVEVGGKFYDLRKLNPAGNVISEMVAEGDPSGFIRATHPLVGPAFEALSGHKAGEGLRAVNVDGKSSPPTGPENFGLDDRALIWLASALQMPYLTREAGAATKAGKQSDESLPFLHDPIRYKDEKAIARNEQRKQFDRGRQNPLGFGLRQLGVAPQSAEEIQQQIDARNRKKAPSRLRRTSSSSGKSLNTEFFGSGSQGGESLNTKFFGAK